MALVRSPLERGPQASSIVIAWDLGGSVASQASSGLLVQKSGRAGARRSVVHKLSPAGESDAGHGGCAAAGVPPSQLPSVSRQPGSSPSRRLGLLAGFQAGLTESRAS